MPRQGILRAAVATAVAGLVAACSAAPPVPAPVIQKGGAPGFAGEAPIVAMPMRTPVPRPPGEARRIVVRPGQSLSRIAVAYHVPARAIIAANHLTPPYKIEIGQRLVIPGSAEPAPHEAIAARPPAPPVAAHASPDIIPLDGPPPKAAPEHRPSAMELTPPAAAPVAASLPPEPSAAEEARAESAEQPPASAHGGHFPWPVRGRVLASYGVAAGGRHNDGINIAAPLGTPVRAVDGGVVAYAGNELRGYGNLVLIKHPDGFISAYAHCEELLVKRGQRVRRGQVIAKVGATGSVGEPQLHFELRRGKKAVDPRDFLTPAPSAASRDSSRNG